MTSVTVSAGGIEGGRGEHSHGMSVYSAAFALLVKSNTDNVEWF